MRTYPNGVGSAIRQAATVLTICFGLIVQAPMMFGASKSVWRTIPPDELAETAPKLEPEAPAEAIIYAVEVDDAAFPEERIVTEYIRYKIFAPDKVTNLTRVSGIDSTATQNRTELRARLTLPDGTANEFGAEAIKERTLSKTGQEQGLLGWLTNSSVEVKEKFLAVPGVETGAVLEYYIRRRLAGPLAITKTALQRENIPVREATYTCRLCRDNEHWGNRTFGLNLQSGKITEDKKTRTVYVTASNLPSIVREPFVGPETDYALTVVSSYERYDRLLLPRSNMIPDPGEIPAKLGPWAVHATLINWFERDRGYPTKRTKELAAEITRGVDDPEARARAIHQYVQDLHQKYTHRTGPRPAGRATTRTMPESLDDIIAWEKRPDVVRAQEEFLWLAVALYQVAGFEAHTVLLPDRSFSRFNPQYVSPAFLNNMAVAVKLGERWIFTVPQHGSRYPFGMLPWQWEGQQGLLALEKKQEFVKVPASGPDQSEIASTGKFSLTSEGVLTGDCTRTFTGQAAVALRAQLRANRSPRREEIASSRLGFDPKIVEVRVTRIEQIDVAEKPLVITARVRWPGFATRTKDRLMVRAAVFRADAPSPFTASERRLPIHFPYRWTETDKVELTVPEGFSPESPDAPPPNVGEVMSHQLELAYDRSKRTLHSKRSFRSNVLDLAPSFYRPLKAWYDRVALADAHEIVFKRAASPAPAQTTK